MKTDKANSSLLGSRLLKQRSAAGLPLHKVAAAAQISPGYYSSIENSKRIPPSSTLVRILDALGFSKAEKYEIKKLAAVERGLSPDDSELPDDVQTLISEIRQAAAVMPPAFVKAIRSQIREISR